MNDSNDAAREEALARLAEEAERLVVAGEEPDPAKLAERFDVSLEDAEDCVASLTAVGDLLFGDLDDEPEPVLPPPDLPDDYEIQDEIGRGGMGVVYRARQKSLGRTVAVKVIRPGVLGFEESVKRFRKEAKSLARLRHPGIVSIHEVGVAGDAVYFSMDLIEGGSLADRLADGRLHPGEAVRILVQVASAIAHTHERGIIHRDLKPANVLLDRDGNAWVVDFGLARDAALSVDATGTGRILGTPAYMSPEQAAGDTPVGEPTDVYALGALLYECLTGEAPFAGRPLGETIHAVIHEEPVPPRRRNALIPRDLETIVLTAMAKRQADRYRTVRALLADLRAFTEGAPIRAKRPGILHAARGFARRHRSAIVAAAVTAVLLSIVIRFGLLPRIGRTPETLAATAAELHEDGEARAALTLYEQAIALLPEGEPAPGLHRGRADCRAALAREALLAGRLEEADAALEETLTDADAALGRTGWPAVGRVLWDRTRIATGLEGIEAGRKAFKVLNERLKDNELERERREKDFRPFGTFEAVHARILDLIAGGLDAPPPLDRIAATFLLELGSRHSLDAGPVTDWLLRQGDATMRHLVSMVRAHGAAPLVPRREQGYYWKLFDLCRALVGRRRGELESALASLAADENETTTTRAVALDLLSRFADLPRPAPRTPRRWEWREWDEAGAAATLETWRRARESEADEALRLRVDLGVERNARRWLMAHTGHEAEDGVGWRRWWAGTRDRDPREWLAESVTMPFDVDVADPVSLLAHLPQARDDARFRFHLLLTMAAPEHVTPPVFLFDRREPKRGLVAAWREALDAAPPGEPWLLRVAFFWLTDADPPEILWEEIRPIGIGEPVSLCRTHEEPVPWSARFGIPGLGSLAAPATPARSSWSGGLLLEYGADGLRLQSGAASNERRGPGGGMTRAWDGGGVGVHAGMILPIGGMEGYAGTVNSFPLAVALPPGADTRPWTIDDWRSKLAENLAFLAKGYAAEERGSHTGPFSMSYQKSLWLHPMIAAKIGLPGEVALLDRFPERVEPFGGEDDWRAARLMAGDTKVLATDPETLRKTAGKLNDTKAPLWWGRLFLSTEEPQIRALAAGVLLEMELPDGVATAIAARGADLPDALREKVAGAGMRALWGSIEGLVHLLAIGALLWIAALLSTALALVHRRSLRPAAWMVLAGLGFLSLTLFRYESDLLPDAVGLALASTGAVILARRAGGRAGRIAAGAFLVALALDLMARLAAPEALRTVAGAAVAAALLSLPWLAHRLAGGSQRRRFPLFLLLYGGPALVVWGGGVALLLLGETGQVSLTIPGGDLLFPASALAALWAAVRLVVLTPRA